MDDDEFTLNIVSGSAPSSTNARRRKVASKNPVQPSVQKRSHSPGPSQTRQVQRPLRRPAKEQDLDKPRQAVSTAVSSPSTVPAARPNKGPSPAKQHARVQSARPVNGSARLSQVAPSNKSQDPSSLRTDEARLQAGSAARHSSKPRKPAADSRFDDSDDEDAVGNVTARAAPRNLHAADNAIDFGSGGGGRAKGGKKARRRDDRTADDEDDGIQLQDDELLEVMQAVKKSQTREQALALELRADPTPAERGGASDDSDDAAENAGTVDFMGGRKATAAGRKRKRKEAEGARDAQARRGGEGEGGAAKKAKAASAAVVPGALAQKGSKRAVPAESRAAIFGDLDVTTFHGLGLSEALSAHLESSSYTTPTIVQREVIPYLLRGCDVMMRAPTGTGKTLAYLAPIIQDLGGQQPRISRAEGTHALIITPTRELTLQVHDVASTLAKRFIWLVTGLLIGGENRHHEKQRLRRGVVILVATPGRLLDHLQSTASFLTSALKWLVLDEADRLMDMGFEHTVTQIVDLLEARCGEVTADSRRQTVLASATLNAKLGVLASRILHDPVPVGTTASVNHEGHLSLANAALEGEAGLFELPKGLRQLYMDVPVKLRLPTLLGTIRLCFGRTPKCKLVVFLTTCDSVELHHALFTATFRAALGESLVDCSVFKLHGDMPAGDRTDSMMGFHQSENAVLLCTDVAARGLDFPAVTHIVQYDPPGEAAEYVQRVGRTARMGKRGVAILFLASSEIEYKEHLERQGIVITQQKLFPSLNTLPSAVEAPKRSAPTQREANKELFQAAMDSARACQAALMAKVSEDPTLQALAADAFRSYVGAYATHPHHLREIFHVRKLHLGHVAHSFALKEQPKRLGQSAAKQARKARKSESAAATKKSRFKAIALQGKEYQTVKGLV